MKIENILEQVEIGDIVLLRTPLNGENPVGYVIELSENVITLGDINPMRSQYSSLMLKTSNYPIAPYNEGLGNIRKSHFRHLAIREFEILRKYKREEKKKGTFL